METEIVFLVLESPEGGYEAEALGHAIFTEADAIDELRVTIMDAVQCHLMRPSIPKSSVCISSTERT